MVVLESPWGLDEAHEIHYGFVDPLSMDWVFAQDF